MFELLKSVIKTPTIEFLCDPQDENVIPVPFPAVKYLPDWYKHLPQKINKENKLENSTIKRCFPFIDAMALGWIIPLAADVEIITNNDASGLTWKSNFYKVMIENHGKDQISTKEHPHPSLPKPPMKFLNHWAIKVPDGYSVLFIPPLNRPDQRFECISGLVDCDKYWEFVNFPFFFKEPNYTGILRAGVPLIQCIPIKRNALVKEAKVKTLTKEDQEGIELTRRKRKSHASFYRDECREKK
jgi:hypothetical protein